MLYYVFSNNILLHNLQIFPDAACHRKILDLSVKCSYFRCSWAGELRDVEVRMSCFCFPGYYRKKNTVKNLVKDLVKLGDLLAETFFSVAGIIVTFR